MQPSRYSTTNLSSIVEPYFQVYDQEFLTLLPSSPSIKLILQNPNGIPQFHEAAVVYSTNPLTIFVTSNQYNLTDPVTNTVKLVTTVSKITQLANGTYVASFLDPSPSIPFANGGFKYGDSILFNAQGNLTAGGGLTIMSASLPYDTTVLLNNYLGVPFDSPNDVHVLSDTSIWFTDNPVGYPQGIRPAPLLPGAVYRFMPNTTDLRVMIEDITRPNGITFSPNEEVCYVTATSATNQTSTGGRTIYAYDVVNATASATAQVHLSNKRVFARVPVGIPDGIKTDTEGNVYVGCGDGIHVWNESGRLLGSAIFEGGISNFALAKGAIYALYEDKVYLIKLASSVVGVGVE